MPIDSIVVRRSFSFSQPRKQWSLPQHNEVICETRARQRKRAKSKDLVMQLLQEWWWTSYHDHDIALVKLSGSSSISMHAVKWSEQTWPPSCFRDCQVPLGVCHSSFAQILRSKHLDHCSSKPDHGIFACALRHPELLIPWICGRAIV